MMDTVIRLVCRVHLNTVIVILTNHSGLRWPQYTLLSKVADLSSILCLFLTYGNFQVIVELNSENETILPDTYRENQIAFIIDSPLAFRH